MLSGDEAACAEARDLIPEVETATVKRGIKRGSAAGMGARANVTFNSAAIHVAPQRARELIREAAKRGLQNRDNVSLWKPEAPYVRTLQMRSSIDSGRRLLTYHSNDPIELFNSAPEVEILDEIKEQ
jgi:D-aminopeptidase